MVARAMARWPDVPAAFGWLSLDRRGDWRIKGERITNTGLIEFIGRNYACDTSGRWYFQNGPQRVYVRIEHLPFILSVEAGAGAPGLRTQTAHHVDRVDGVWLGPGAELVIGFDGCAGVICDRDLSSMLEWVLDASGRRAEDALIEAALETAQCGMPTGLALRLADGVHHIGVLDAADPYARFGFVADPQPAPGQPEC